MRILRYKNIFLFALVLTTFSCEDFLGGNLNEDPNKPIAVPITGILPQVQISLADTYGGSFSRWNCMFVQQVEGVARQWSSFKSVPDSGLYDLMIHGMTTMRTYLLKFSRLRPFLLKMVTIIIWGLHRYWKHSC